MLKWVLKRKENSTSTFTWKETYKINPRGCYSILAQLNLWRQFCWFWSPIDVGQQDVLEVFCNLTSNVCLVDPHRVGTRMLKTPIKPHGKWPSSLFYISMFTRYGSVSFRSEMKPNGLTSFLTNRLKCFNLVSERYWTATHERGLR